MRFRIFQNKDPQKQKAKNKSRLWRILKYTLLLFLLFLIYILWPVRHFLTPSFLTGTHLVLITNEAELRPCGGFMTMYGTVQILPPKVDLNNAFSFEKKLGASDFPINKINPEKVFWDLGDTPDLNKCARQFRTEYEKAFPSQEIDQVILSDFQTAQKLFALFGDMKFQGQIWNAENLFAQMTRMVSDIDRHDEAVLANRKTPIANLGKRLVMKMIFHPFIAPKTTRILQDAVKEGHIFMPNYSPEIQMNNHDFAVLEWNLGGGKSSRFLKKTLQIEARQKQNLQWDFQVTFRAEHLGGYDEPISQDWHGYFEIRMPDFLDSTPIWLENQIRPGETLEKSWLYENMEIPNRALKGPSWEYLELSVFRHRGQKLFLDLDISLFPQQNFLEANFEHHENVGHYFGEVESWRQRFFWKILPDTISPFPVFHQKTAPPGFETTPENNFPVEIHFNELVKLSPDFSAQLLDRDYKIELVTENIDLKNFELLPDQKTLVLYFHQTVPQPQERFYLKMSGVKDLFGNEMRKGQWTIIDR